jgi:hypothetical protein
LVSFFFDYTEARPNGPPVGVKRRELEQEMAGDVGAFGAAGLQDERRYVVAGQAQEQIGVDQFALVSYLFVCIETRKGAPRMRQGRR